MPVSPAAGKSRDARLHGRCHCGAVQFRVALVDGLNTARRCNCSMCRMRGAVAVAAALDDIEITAGRDVLSEYAFNTRAARHFFCSVCGIYTHHRRRSNPGHYGVNLACLDGMSPFDLPEVVVLYGANHPRDTGRGANAATSGVLKFEKAAD